MAGSTANANGIDLNAAREEDLARIEGIGPERAKDLVRSRPYQTWEDLKRVPGFGDTLVDELRDSGAILGATEQSR